MPEGSDHDSPSTEESEEEHDMTSTVEPRVGSPVPDSEQPDETDSYPHWVGSRAAVEPGPGPIRRLRRKGGRNNR